MTDAYDQYADQQEIEHQEGFDEIISRVESPNHHVESDHTITSLSAVLRYAFSKSDRHTQERIREQLADFGL